MKGISTHVLDTARGRPASGMPVALDVRSEGGAWATVGRGTTDSDGRAKLMETSVPRAVYRLVFDAEAYFRAWNVEGFYPEVSIVFEVRDPAQKYHVPLLLSPFGFSTYRGS
ncbi:MAG TPA: hydroxyisourate hydrolase [Thermoanaerobaculia bacterium]